MSTLAWIVSSGLAMSAIALVGAVTLVLSEETLDKILLPLVGLAAGSLLGGAAFHMLPAGLAASENVLGTFAWCAAGFTVFFALELLLHRHHCRRASAPCRSPMTYLILVGDALHNFMGGLAVGGAFLLDIRLGIMTWLAAVAHEIPQELGDFGVLIHGGWEKRKALMFNLFSALTFPLGGIVAYAVSFHIEVGFLLPFAAGNFVYIAASDLIPEANRAHDGRQALWSLGAFIAGLLLLYLLAFAGAAR